MDDLLDKLGSVKAIFRVPHCPCYRSGMVMGYNEALKRYCCPACGCPATSPGKGEQAVKQADDWTIEGGTP